MYWLLPEVRSAPKVPLQQNRRERIIKFFGAKTTFI
jgi:hypothetical protein